MLSQDVWEGYEGRLRLLNPFFSFGKGINLGPILNPYIENILMATILELFYREVRNNEDRTERHLQEIIKDVLEEMKLGATAKDRERIGTGLLYSNPQTLEAFQRPYYDPRTRKIEVQQFKYLVPDHDAMDEHASTIIYKLSDDAQYILFSSREITSEMSITLEQLYMIQLLKKGNIDGILRQTDFLLSRVKTLITKEKEYGRELAREPKIILREGFEDRSKREQEIRNQFDEEDENFNRMYNLLHRLEEKNEGLYDAEAKQRMHEIRERLNQTTNKHAEFNTMVTRNIAFIIDIRTNRPELLMRKSTRRYKEDIWEKLIRIEGIGDEELFHALLNPLISPIAPTLFSMDRLWEKQKVTAPKETEESEEETEEFERIAFEYVLNWKNIMEKWIPIMEELMETGSFYLQSIENLEGWSKDSIDLWFQFTKGPFNVPNHVSTEENHKDERQEFIKQLILRNKDFKRLLGKTIFIENEGSQLLYYEKTVLLTNGMLRIKKLNEGE